MKPDKSKYTQNSGFKVPDNYFGNLEERILSKIQEDTQAQIPVKSSGFLIPESYFDSLEDKIMAKNDLRKPRVISLLKKEYLFYAAAVVAIFALMLGDFFKSDQEQTIASWDDIEISAMENYIDDGYEMGYIELSTSDFSEFMFPGNQLVDEEDFNSVDTEAAFEYIEENIEDPTYILE